MKKVTILCDICGQEVDENKKGTLHLSWKGLESIKITPEIILPEKLEINYDDICEDCSLIMRNTFIGLLIKKNPDFKNKVFPCI
jgi:hypothetical protein